MKPTTLRLAVSCAVMAYAIPVAGQDRHRAGVFAGGGISRMGGDEGSLGSGFSVVAGFGYRVTSRLSLEIDLTRAQHDRNIAGGPLEGTAWTLRLRPPWKSSRRLEWEWRFRKTTA